MSRIETSTRLAIAAAALGLSIGVAPETTLARTSDEATTGIVHGTAKPDAVYFKWLRPRPTPLPTPPRLPRPLTR
ncbi:MAG: hypothetical protein R3D27_12385 [Hyphomicrobiaceae bacterium]